jgi:hypothetical protein
VLCETAGCPDPHDVANAYEWSNVVPDPNGNAYTDFLARLNGLFNPDAATGCFANRCDWRLPVVSELQSILVGPDVTFSSTNVDPADSAMGTNPTGQSSTCGSAPCIDPLFAAIGGPTASSSYWSASTFVPNPFLAWNAHFANGSVSTIFKTPDGFVRAVRAGSCGS